jgi:hypothetical protein
MNVMQREMGIKEKEGSLEGRNTSCRIYVSLPSTPNVETVYQSL